MRSLTVVVMGLCSALLMAAEQPVWVQNAATAALPAARPSLVVLLVVDQMRADYVTSYGSTWTRGLHDIFTNGAWFTEAAYPYARTKTCVGHATIGTGRLPTVHGMIDNDWFDPVKRVFTTCTEDPSAQALVYAGKTGVEHHSAKWLLAPTFADELVRQSGGRSRVASMSLKARSAIGLAGHGSPTTTITWEEDTGGVFATSTAFAKRLSPEIDEFVRAHPVKVEQFQDWTRAMPESAYRYADQAPGEPTGGATFPHLFEAPIRTSRTTPELLDSWEQTPFTDGFLAGLAMHMVDRQRLGQRNALDLLAVSFTSLDTVGHRYGPKSHEVQDTLFRLDQEIGRLIDALDQKVGRGRYVLALSSDHGVADLPEQVFPAAAGRGRGAPPAAAALPPAASPTEGGPPPASTAPAVGRPGAPAPAATGGTPGAMGRVSLTAVGTAVETALDKLFGRGSYVEAVSSMYLYFRPGVLDRIRSSPDAVKAVESAAVGVRGVSKIFWSADLGPAAPSADPILMAVRKSYFAGRSGDLAIVPMRDWLLAGPADHGTPYDYDQRVPLVLFGAGIKAGTHATNATPVDIVPTLSALTGITMPGTDGRVLTEALQSGR